MMTNIIAYLHTTIAYQSAAMQLMVGQANFDAQQLHLKETLPLTVPANTNEWKVAMPPDGVAGGFATANYIYRFDAGKLELIQKKPRKPGMPEDPADTEPSLVDTNGAYELARQWLAGISVDVTALESKYPHHVTQIDARPTPGTLRRLSQPPERAKATNRVAHAAVNRPKSPKFEITWGGSAAGSPATSNRFPVQITMEIQGATKQCLGVRIFNPDLVKSPPLRITNAEALLGTPPSPQQFVEGLLGGRTAYNTIAQPDRITAWLLSVEPDENGNKANRTAVVAVEANTALLISRALTDFNSYAWLEEQGGLPDYGVHLKFTKGADNVDVLWCGDCDHIQFIHNGAATEKDCPGARAALVRAMQTIFPSDEIVKKLRPFNSSQPK